MNEVEAQRALAALREMEQRQFLAQESERLRRASAPERAFAEACRTLLDDRVRHWRNVGYIREHRIEASHERPGCTVIRLEHWHGQTQRYDVWDDELRMGGLDGFRDLLRRIERELERSSFINSGTTGTTATEVLSRNQQTLEQMRQMMLTFNPPIFFAPGTLRGDWQSWQNINFNGPDYEAGKKAEQKSKDLFRAVAGQQAFDVLEIEGGWIGVTGSSGGKYRLYKRASFCVERASDREQLCAMVPGVPLWDHLLGVKLMIEHDEPRFLKVANRMGSVGFVQSGTGFAWAQPR